jgi:chromosome partitioning protein
VGGNLSKTVCFISEKGGVGKTTACFEIAVALTRVLGKKILVIDADYQRGGISGRLDPSLIPHFSTGSVPGTTLFHKFQQLYSAVPVTLDLSVLKSSFDIDFVPADPRLSSISEDKIPAGRTIRENSEASLSHLKLIHDVLGPIRDSYDYVLIDSHPEVSHLLRSVIYASEYAVSPVKLDLQSSIGVPTIIGEIDAVNEDVTLIKAALGRPQHYVPTAFAGAIGMMAREWGGTLKDTEDTEYRRLVRVGSMFKNYVTEGDGIRRAAQNRTTVRTIQIANAKKQAAQFEQIANEFVVRCL